MDWTEEARKAVSRVPFFVRKRVRKRVEEEAAQSGAGTVTIEHVRSSQRRFLERMEDEVKGYRVETCFGPSGCSNRAIVAEDIPQQLQELVSKRNLKAFLKERVDGPLKMHHEFRISVSDCPNACSRPQVADIGMLGACVPKVTDRDCSRCGACVEACKEEAVSLNDQGPFIDHEKCLYCGQCVRACPEGALEEGKRGYRIQLGGKLGRHPRLATELATIYDVDEVMEIVNACLDHYQQHCHHGERFGEILEREGLGALDETLPSAAQSREGTRLKQ